MIAVIAITLLVTGIAAALTAKCACPVKLKSRRRARD
jgi:hypothetical protein